MSHMQHEITGKQIGWKIETKQGTCYLPREVEGVPEWLRRDMPLDLTDDMPEFIASAVRSRLGAYVEGGPDSIQSVEVLPPQYFARLSAPGYLDCTDWTVHDTIKGAREYLRDI